MRRALTGLLVLVSVGCLFFPVRADRGDEPEPIIDETVGELHFTYRMRFGSTLEVAGVPVIRESTIWVGQPGTYGNWFYAPMDQPALLTNAKIDKYKGGRRIVLQHEDAGGGPFKATETIMLLPDNVFRTRLEFTFSSSDPAWIEWFPIVFRPAAFVGTPYKMGKQSGEVRLPTENWPWDPARAHLARGWETIAFDSRLGPIEIEASPKDNDIVLDYRRGQWAMSGPRGFWIGLRKEPLTANKTCEYEFTIRFPESLDGKEPTPRISSSSAPVRPVPDAIVPHWGQDYILPTPKELTYNNDRLPLSATTKLIVGESPGEGVERALKYFLEQLEIYYHLRPEVIRKTVTKSVPGAIVIGDVPRFTLASDCLSTYGLVAPDRPESYAIAVDGNGAYLAARNDKGIFYGVNTLLQLIEVTDQGIRMKGCRILDYPALQFRGVHAFTGKNAGDEIARTLKVFLARNKMNTFVWECEYIVWDSHPEIAHPQYGMSKKEAAKVIDAAKQLGIDIVPLIQSLGHSEWMFSNRQHLNLAEDPSFPYAYTISKPETYTFIFSVFQEALDFFHPRIFHIGHDEITLRGRFPLTTKDKTVTQILLEDTNKLHDWLKERGVRAMMWGDMLLYRTDGPDACLAPSLEEAQARREGIPRDTLIADWHYAAVPPEGYKSLNIFKGNRFQTVGAGWFNPDNIRNLAKACADTGALGYLQTTWAGFDFAIDGNDESWIQYRAYIPAAEYAWTGNNQPLVNKPWDPEDLFLDLWFERKPELKAEAGFLVDLRPLYNCRLEDTPQSPGWVGLGAGQDLVAFPSGRHRLGATFFQLMRTSQGQGAVLLDGLMNPKGEWPNDVVIGLGGVKASRLCFLMTAAFRAKDGRHAGDIVVEYADATRDTLPLTYGENVFAFDDYRMSRSTWLAWRGKTGTGARVGAWNVQWTNPNPGKAIARISLRSRRTEAAPILLGLTGVE